MEDEKKSVQQTIGTKRATRGRKTASGDTAPLAEEGGEALEIPRAKRPGRRKDAAASSRRNLRMHRVRAIRLGSS